MTAGGWRGARKWIDFTILSWYTKKEAKAYKTMYKRYLDLKAILQAFGINLTDIDRIKE